MLACGYSSEGTDKPTAEIENGLKQAVKKESRKSIKSERAYYLTLFELARVKEAQQCFSQADNLYRRVAHEVEFARDVPETTISEIWLKCAQYWERRGKNEDALLILNSISTVHHHILKYKTVLLAYDYNRSIAYSLESLKAQIRILQMQNNNDTAANLWHSSRFFFNELGEDKLVGKAIGEYGAVPDTQQLLVRSGYQCWPIPEDAQCYFVKPYRGRTLTLTSKHQWILNPKYTKMLAELALRSSLSGHHVPKHTAPVFQGPVAHEP